MQEQTEKNFFLTTTCTGSSAFAMHVGFKRAISFTNTQTATRRNMRQKELDHSHIFA